MPNRRSGCIARGRVRLGAHQCVAVVAWTCETIGFYLLFLPSLANDALRWACAGVYGALALIVACAFAHSSGTDPSAAVVGESDDVTSLYCRFCDARVAPRAKHCRDCDKCVDDFDHHCNWLNNCVGGKNYRSFFVLVCATFAQIAGQAACGAGLAAWCAIDPARARAYVNDEARYVGNGVGFVSLIVGLCVYIAIGIGLLYVVGELLVFHLALARKRLSTYEYIVAERAIAADLKAKALERGENADDIVVRTSVCRLCNLPDEYVPARPGKEKREDAATKREGSGIFSPKRLSLTNKPSGAFEDTKDSDLDSPPPLRREEALGNFDAELQKLSDARGNERKSSRKK